MTETKTLKGRDDDLNLSSSSPTPPRVAASQGEGDFSTPPIDDAPPSPSFISLAKMIGLEDPEDVEPFKDTITHLQVVVSNLECFEFTEQRRTAIRRMTELIVKYLEE